MQKEMADNSLPPGLEEVGEPPAEEAKEAVQWC